MMAITCTQCGANFDVTLFQFGHRVLCDCGHWVELDRGHVEPLSRKAGVPMEEELGRVSHYFSKIGVAAIELTHGTLHVGDTIHVKGHTSDFTQKVDSMQLDGKDVTEATVGQSVGFKVHEHAREHDAVYKVSE